MALPMSTHLSTSPMFHSVTLDMGSSSGAQAASFAGRYSAVREQLVQQVFAPNALGMIDNSYNNDMLPTSPLNWDTSLRAFHQQEETRDDGWKKHPETQEWFYEPDETTGHIEELDENDEPIPNDNALENIPLPPTPCERHAELPTVHDEEPLPQQQQSQHNEDESSKCILDQRDIVILVEVSALAELVVADLNNIASCSQDGLPTACACLLSPLHSIRDALRRRMRVLSDEWRCGSDSWYQRYEERVSSLSRTLTRIRSITIVALRPRRPKSQVKFQKAACAKLNAHEHKLRDLASKFHASLDRLHARHRHKQATSVYGYRVERRRRVSITGTGTSAFAHRHERRPSLSNLNNNPDLASPRAWR